MLQKAINIIPFVLFLLGFFSISYPIYGENCRSTLKGVLHNQAHEPLVGATVYIKELKIGVISNQKGAFFFRKICQGEYTLIIRMIGFKTREIQVMIRENWVSKDFELEDEALHLEEIAITGQKVSLADQQTQSAFTLSQDLVENNYGRTLGEIVGEAPGVNILQTGPTINKPVIQGLHSNRILLLNNGVRQADQQWGSEHAPSIDPFLTSRFTIIKGAAAVRYGPEAIAGVILSDPPALPNEAGLGGAVNLVGQTNGRGGAFSSIVEGGIKAVPGLGWRLQGTLRGLGDSEAPDYILSNTGVREFNVSGALGYQKKDYGLEVFFSRFATELGILRSAHTGGLNDLENAIASDAPNFVEPFTYSIQNLRQEVVHTTFKVEGFWQNDKLGTFKLIYGNQLNRRKEFDIRRGGRSNLAALFMDLTTHSLDLIWQHKPWKAIQGEVGITTNLQTNRNVDLAERGIRPLIPNYNSYSGGVFWIERLQRANWEFELGIRYDYQYLDVRRRDRSNNLLNPRLEYHNFTATLGAIYYINDYLSVRSNIASAWRPPNVAELFSEGLHHGVATIEEGNPDLESEKGYKWVNTLNFQHQKASVEVSAYVHYLPTYIFLEPRDTRLTIRGAFPVFVYNQTRATLTGLDISGSYQLAKQITWQGQVSIVRAKDQTRNGFFVLIPADRFENTIQYTQQNWAVLKDLSIAVGILNVRRQTRAPITITPSEAKAIQADDTRELPNESFDFLDAPAGYFLLNLDIGFSLPLPNQNLRFSFSADNLLNKSYRAYMNRLRYYADDLGRNFTVRILYNWGLRV